MLKDEDGDGVPDIVERNTDHWVRLEETTYTVNGVEYASLDDMPPEVRRTYESMMGPLDADGDGIPDGLQFRAPSIAAAPLDAPSPFDAPLFDAPSDNAPDEEYERTLSRDYAPRRIDPQRRGGLFILLMAALLLCVAALIGLGVWALLG